MAGSHPDIPYSLPAAADLSARQYCNIVINSSGQVALATAGADSWGVLDNPDADALGKPARFWPAGTPGPIKAKAGGTIAAADLLSVGTNGVFVKSVTSTHKYVAIAIAAAASGDIFEVLMMRGLGAVP